METEADGRDTVTSPGTPGVPRDGRGGKDPPWSLWREHGPGTPGPRTLVSRSGAEGDVNLVGFFCLF